MLKEYRLHISRENEILNMLNNTVIEFAYLLFPQQKDKLPMGKDFVFYLLKFIT